VPLVSPDAPALVLFDLPSDGAYFSYDGELTGAGVRDFLARFRANLLEAQQVDMPSHAHSHEHGEHCDHGHHDEDEDDE
jgi:hypothetical protein